LLSIWTGSCAPPGYAVAEDSAPTNWIVVFRSRSIRPCDGNLITGQQQYSGGAVARLMSAALVRVTAKMRAISEYG
jgi:hypothetical protein